MVMRDLGIGRRFSDDYELEPAESPEHHEERYRSDVIPDLPEGDDGRPEDWPDPPVPGADDA